MRSLSMPISNRVKQFACDETDLSVFLMSQSQQLQVTLSILPGPTVTNRTARTFSFMPDAQLRFLIEELILLPGAQKLIFYSSEHIGEVDLTGYPWTNAEYESVVISPSIKIHKVFQPNVVTGSRSDISTQSKLMYVQPSFVGKDGTEWNDQLFLLMTNLADYQITLRLEAVSASNLLDSAANIARINTHAEAAYNAAHFT